MWHNHPPKLSIFKQPPLISHDCGSAVQAMLLSWFPTGCSQLAAQESLMASSHIGAWHLAHLGWASLPTPSGLDSPTWQPEHSKDLSMVKMHTVLRPRFQSSHITSSTFYWSKQVQGQPRFPGWVNRATS